MSKLVPENHPALHTIAEEVPEDTITSKEIQKVISDMKSALAACPQGVALAAPQIGVSLRIFIVHDTHADTHDHEGRIPDLVAINPKIVKHSAKKEELEEGCLSVPRLYGNTMRYEQVTMRAFDENGEEYERGAGGLLAQIFQHEIDHLDGILYTDHAHNTWETGDDYNPLET